jgi:hypothetical protein
MAKGLLGKLFDRLDRKIVKKAKKKCDSCCKR